MLYVIYYANYLNNCYWNDYKQFTAVYYVKPDVLSVTLKKMSKVRRKKYHIKY